MDPRDFLALRERQRLAEGKLLRDLCSPAHSLAVLCDVQVNEFVKRVRAFRIHLLIIGHIKHAMPALFGKDKAAKKMLTQLPEIFRQVRVW